MREYNFEGAWDNISSIYYGDDDKIRDGIAKVLVKLPEEVRDFVLDECFFISTGKSDYGTVWASNMPSEYRLKPVKWIILLSENIKAKDMESVVAHEIAHAYPDMIRCLGQ